MNKPGSGWGGLLQLEFCFAFNIIAAYRIPKSERVFIFILFLIFSVSFLMCLVVKRMIRAQGQGRGEGEMSCTGF